MAKDEKPESENRDKRLYLVDASSYAFRAYHATARQGLSTSKGMPTGAAMVFVNMVLKLLREEKPTHLAIVWDAKGKNFRHEMYPEYKANRAETPPDLGPQIDYMRRVSNAFNLAELIKEGYEADDVIGTLAERARSEGIETVIVSGDKDLTQLVGDGVIMLDTMKDARIGPEQVMERFGVPPEKVADVLGLMGDSSDNVPGVPKVGEKTAKKLVAEHGSLEDVLANADEIKGKVGENLREFAEQARLSRRLVELDKEVPLDFSWDLMELGEPDREKLTELFRELEFTRLMNEFGVERETVDYSGFRAIMDRGELEEFLAAVRESRRVCVDTETDSTDATRANLVAISLAVEPGEAVYVPVGHIGAGSEGQLSRETVKDLVRPVLEDPAIEKIGQNLKYDYNVLARAGIHLAGIGFDTMVASYLVNPRRRVHNLDELASEFLDHRMIKYEDICGKGKKQIPYAAVPMDQAVRYSCEDVDVALRLMNELAPRLDNLGLRKLFDEVEMPLVPVLARMEAAGVKVDTDKLSEMSKNFEKKISVLREKVFETAGEEFNLDSPKQLSTVLFEKMGLPSAKKTKTGFSTNEAVLVKLAEEFEIASLILEYRGLTKLKNTYTDALTRLVNPETGRIHTSFNQTVTSTGRLSSSEPNLQNIPVRSGEGKMIREAFVGEDGNLIMAADYSQIELRLMAHISGEPALIDAFEKGEDIHARTAAEVFGVPAGEVTADMRRHAKVINFGILYGMSAHGLTVQLGVDHKEARAYIDRYFERYPKVREYMDSVVEKARSEGFVSTIMGRRLPLPEINSKNQAVRAAVEREAINAPLQGSAADIIKVAMIRIDRAMAEREMRSGMIMQVHDELVFEVVPAELDELTALVKDKMESARELRVALEVEVATEDNWAEAH